jgi:hypothetical protein
MGRTARGFAGAAFVFVTAGCASGVTPVSAATVTVTVSPTATVTVTAPAAASVPASAAPTPSATDTKAKTESSWSPDADQIGLAPSPYFPGHLMGWELHRKWTALDRAFTGGQWMPLSGSGYTPFPSTMNGCGAQRFLVRWRAVNPNARVAARWADAAGGGGKIVTGTAGWMNVNGCLSPEFRLLGSSDGSTLTDVTAAVQQLWPAP